MTRLSGYGVSIELPTRWEGQIRGLIGSRAGAAPASAARDDPDRPLALLHVANFALPAQRGDFGSGAVERMGPADIFVGLLEQDPSDVDLPLFARSGLPTLTPALFSPAQMQRTIAGMEGAQQFFSWHDRAFCLYVVVGSSRTKAPLVRSASSVVRSLQVDAT